jgi:hypothetical protein
MLNAKPRISPGKDADEEHEKGKGICPESYSDPTPKRNRVLAGNLLC